MTTVRAPKWNSRCGCAVFVDETADMAVRDAREIVGLLHDAQSRTCDNRHVDTPEETRELPDVTIRARETSTGRFEANFRPTSPTHPARQGFTVDTRQGARGKTLAQVLEWAEGYWRRNYPT
jgi:hypothetical protein